jgi:hypothetical protein
MRMAGKLGMLLAALLLMVAAAAPASAAKTPNGSYRQSCSNIRVKDASSSRAELSASCRDYKGRDRHSSLRYKQCRADIANINGQLGCWGPGPRPPGGSWSLSCRNGYVQHSVLYANCQRRNGDWWKASINLSRCPRNRIANINGQLKCE